MGRFSENSGEELFDGQEAKELAFCRQPRTLRPPIPPCADGSARHLADRRRTASRVSSQSPVAPARLPLAGQACRLEDPGAVRSLFGIFLQ